MIVSRWGATINCVPGLCKFVNKVLTLTMLIVMLFALTVSDPLPAPRAVAMVMAKARIIQAERVDLSSLRPRKRNPLMRTRDFE
jgi:hypothetical protein